MFCGFVMPNHLDQLNVDGRCLSIFNDKDRYKLCGAAIG
jgi:hypothetical protein